MKILLISDNSDFILKFIDLFENKEELRVLKNQSNILEHAPKSNYDIIFCELKFIKTLPFEDSDFSVASTSLGYDPSSTKFVLITDKKSIKEAMFYIRGGSLSYVTAPLTEDEIIFACQNKIPQKIKQPYAKGWLPEDASMLRTANLQMKTLYEQLRLVAMKSTTVLISGETGTGKGVAAKLLHSLSDRRNKPFISVHCGALPETLLESELFGHEKGSFTGATRQKKGKFELAQGGTIFLDEIGTVSLDIQIKLLQVLQERKIVRIGGESAMDLNIRVIAATNEDLMELCDAGRFRRDLYYRLNVFPLYVPPLRERKEDLPIICSSLIQKFNTQQGKNIIGIDPLLSEALQNYEWPGNIRELENLFERAFILENSDTLTAQSFPAEILAHSGKASISLEHSSGTLAQVRQEVVARIEKEYIQSNLAVNKGSIKTTAAAAGITTRQLHKLMTKYKIDKNSFKNKN
ncbi:MAG: sigma-54 dependent transcriptional regulator [Lentisphaeraceae bacterium]|nr:sigma-54 dependent transcriptional regulator [Lentisphaeraceae bacterium]